jgi:hypothetical protein
MVQFMLQSGQSDGLSTAHLSFGLSEKLCFLGGQRIVRINQSLRLDYQEPPMPFDGDEITCVEMKFFGDLPGDHDLTTLPDAADDGGLLLCRDCHTFRLSDRQKWRHGIFTANAICFGYQCRQLKVS